MSAFQAAGVGEHGRTMSREKLAAGRAVEKPQTARDSHFPTALRLLEINQTGHFTCYQERTSSPANNRACPELAEGVCGDAACAG
jgi:hypothetical protein